jgi:hypothetical protein
MGMAVSKSASAWTTAAAFPPSSKTTYFLSRLALSAAKPDGGLPVKLNMATRSSVTNAQRVHLRT